jgi:hypothetical protein
MGENPCKTSQMYSFHLTIITIYVHVHVYSSFHKDHDPLLKRIEVSQIHDLPFEV